MALAHSTPDSDLVSDEEFAAAVRRNIKSLLAMQSREQQDLAPSVGISAAVLSSRMTGGKSRTSWRDAELLRVAQALGVQLDVVVALTEQDFRDALFRSRCSSDSPWSERHLSVVPDPPEGVGQGELF